MSFVMTPNIIQISKGHSDVVVARRGYVIYSQKYVSERSQVESGQGQFIFWVSLSDRGLGWTKGE